MIREKSFLDNYGSLDILAMSEITRYSARLKLTHESIAEHSWYVAYYVMQVGRDFNIDENIINKAVSLAMIHDMPEMFTNDVPHNIKVNFPAVKDALDVAEHAYMKEAFPNIFDLYLDLEKDSLEVLLVEIADALSVLLYTNKEMQLGNNTDDFKIISNEVKIRLTKLFEKLERRVNKVEVLGD